jgi:hypothetical protein
MTNSPSKATRYRELAVECVRLSEINADEQTREGFRKLARSYLILAKAELDGTEHMHRGKQYRAYPTG